MARTLLLWMPMPDRSFVLSTGSRAMLLLIVAVALVLAAVSAVSVAIVLVEGGGLP